MSMGGLQPLDPFGFVAAPTANFKTALGATFGDKVKDNFNIKLGDCDKCVAPVPSSLAMLLAGLLGAGAMFARKRPVPVRSM